jgi:flagellum-specific peptidoglycan hydrolase FlgJ
MLWAQWALETGRGASMHGYNFGNVKGRSPAGHSAELETSEGYGAHAERVTARFRTYASADEGARDYLEVLAERFPRSFEAVARGDLGAFASELRREGYFTAEPGAYARGVESLAREHASGRALLRSSLEVQAPRVSVDGLLWTLERARRHE